MKVYFDPKKSVFSPSEIAVIEEVATTLYDSMPHLSRFGTCIIDHQLENPSGYNEAHLAACFDLPSGIFHYQSGPTTGSQATDWLKSPLMSFSNGPASSAYIVRRRVASSSKVAFTIMKANITSW